MNEIEIKADQLLRYAIQIKASDVHIYPIETNTAIYFRIDGKLWKFDEINNSQAEKLITHFKFRSKMDIGERRRPQNGSIIITTKSYTVSLRLSTLPSSTNESLAIRILPQNKLISLNELALYPAQIDQIKSLCHLNEGLILLSGPTGSGKSTTIYAFLQECIRIGKRVITLEDPIEKKVEGTIQVEIQEKIGLTFSEALKSTLRHDPDVIMLGEIRDIETAKIVVRAAMTGHLVISTVHAKDTYGSINRLLEFGISRTDLNETLMAAVSQRLIEVLCPYCGKDCPRYCRMFREIRRLAIFEIVKRQQLDYLLNKEKVINRSTHYQKLVKKAVALGYVDSSDLRRFVIEC
ncbi:MAG: GspE/PulE family protein [Bacillaceae bacterium]|nr:GspE/PulE family protein [Bacillaceae bacterium]